MLKTIVATGAATAAMLYAVALPAVAAPLDPISLSSYTVSVGAPNAPASICDTGSLLNCGVISITARFAGLDGRARPDAPFGPRNGDLTGTVYVIRSYGCQQGGVRLHTYDRTVREFVSLDTRRGSGFRVPLAGDNLSVTTYAFLLDAQPGNCPVDTVPMTYMIKATGAWLVLTSGWDAIPSAHYATPQSAMWWGAVPTPTVAAAA